MKDHFVTFDKQPIRFLGQFIATCVSLRRFGLIVKGKEQYMCFRRMVMIAVAILVLAWIAGGVAHGQITNERFDLLVRDDFFAGFAGDQAALDRVMKTCEDALANPRTPRPWLGTVPAFILKAKRRLNPAISRKRANFSRAV